MSLAVITTYFNPCRYKTRKHNYDLFMAEMAKANVVCLTIECVFDDQDFELDESVDVLRVRANSLLWQKERLLNVAAKALPPSVDKVAWLDCDILFDNKNWAKELEELLDRVAVAQVFEYAIRTGPGGVGEAEPMAVSFAAVMTRFPQTLEAGRYDLHGHTGYGWAMRRSIFDKVGLYEAAVSGSADHFMAHACFNNLGFCVKNALKHDSQQIAHLAEWSREFYREVQGSIGYVQGTIRHLWHGDTSNRRYFLRMHEITDLGFNPYTDLRSLPGKPLEWAPDVWEKKPGLVAYFSNYFKARQEDGAAEQESSVPQQTSLSHTHMKDCTCTNQQ